MISVGCLACVVSTSKSTTLLEEGEHLVETGFVTNGELVVVIALDKGGSIGYLDAKVLNTRGQVGWIYARNLGVVAAAPTYE